MIFKRHTIVATLLVLLSVSCEKETVPVDGLDQLIQAKWQFKKLKAKYYQQKAGQLVHTLITDTNMALSFDRFNQYYDTIVEITLDTINRTPFGSWAISGTGLVLTDSLDRTTNYGLSIPNNSNSIDLSFDTILEKPKTILYQDKEYDYRYVEYQLSGSK